MNQLARETFLRMLAQNPMIYVPSVPAGDDGTPEVPGYYRERTDAELDVLVQYAIRASAACDREAKRFAEANPVPRPLPTSVPPALGPIERPSFLADLVSVLRR